MQNPIVTQSLISLLIVALVVFRFAQRELKERVVKAGTLWIRSGRAARRSPSG